jgi:hypothetical protein
MNRDDGHGYCRTPATAPVEPSISDEQDIASIVAQLQQLQLQQSVLLTRLATINDRNSEREFFDATADTPRDFQVGDRVRVVNPKLFQPRKGVITNIGDSRITIQGQNGTKVQRAPYNLVLEN